MIAIMEIFNRPPPDTRNFAQKTFGVKSPEKVPNIADKLKSTYQDKIKETTAFRRDIVNKNLDNLKLKTSNWIKPKDENTSKFTKFRTGVSNLIKPKNVENIKPRNFVDDVHDMIGARRVEKGFEQKISRLNQLQKNQEAKRNYIEVNKASNKYREQHPIRTALFGATTPQERTGFLGWKGISDLEKAQIRLENIKPTTSLKNQSKAYKSADRFLDNVENRKRLGTTQKALPATNTNQPIPQPAANITQPIQNVINGTTRKKRRLNNIGVTTA